MLSTLFSEVTETNGKVIFADGPTFNTIGKIFDIHPSPGVSYQGMIHVTIPFDRELLTDSSASGVRLLHFNGVEWEDLTVRIDEDAGTVTGQLHSLSPVVAAVVNDGTFGATYFEQNPMARIADMDKSGLFLDDVSEIITILDEEGSMIADTDSITAGSKISIVNLIKNLQRTSQSYSYILEVLDGDGVAVDSQHVKSGTLAQGQSTKITANWTAPIQAGAYTIKIFIIDDSSSPTLLLKNSLSTKIGVA
jgi:hypothetical protein